MLKTCIKCKQEKPFSGFYRHPKMSDGYLGKCRECQKADVRAARERNADYYRAYDARRAMRPDRVSLRQAYQAANPEIVARCARAWQARNPLKREAHVIVGNALRDRKVTRPARCECCQRHIAVQAHHEDYASPLWLAWLCTRCHRLVHKGVVSLGRFHHQRKPF